MYKDQVVFDKEPDRMSRNAEYIHLELKPQMDGLKGNLDKATEKNGKLEEKALRKILRTQCRDQRGPMHSDSHVAL